MKILLFPEPHLRQSRAIAVREWARTGTADSPKIVFVLDNVSDSENAPQMLEVCVRVGRVDLHSLRARPPPRTDFLLLPLAPPPPRPPPSEQVSPTVTLRREPLAAPNTKAPLLEESQKQRWWEMRSSRMWHGAGWSRMTVTGNQYLSWLESQVTEAWRYSARGHEGLCLRIFTEPLMAMGPPRTSPRCSELRVLPGDGRPSANPLNQGESSRRIEPDRTRHPELERPRLGNGQPCLERGGSRRTCRV